ncbi:MAG: Threonylcarbamoyl-AMP synthase [Gammaproteobacteria bacterium]|nr:Threonylcarbamoyl-AMP synthase [Gammaproteobacteria bacterium]
MASPLQLRRAARVVAAGGIIGYPTEAVFGLGCDPASRSSLGRLIALKGRGAGKGFILIAAQIAQLDPWVTFPRGEALRRILGSWPGPYTWVVPARAGVDRRLTGGRDTLAVRVIDHPVASALCRLTGALVSTSANRSGRPPIRDSLRLRAVFGKRIDMVVAGETGRLSGPTEIRDALSGRLIRAAAAR